MRDEFDVEIPELQKISATEWLASGAIETRELAAALGPDFKLEVAGGGRTLSNQMLRRLGRVPPVGEKLKLGDFEATIERVRGATVEQVRLKR